MKEESKEEKKGVVESGVTSKVSTGGEKAGPSASDITYHKDKDWRCYVIVKAPGWLIVGFAEGEGAETWRKPGRRLRGSGARLRRVANWEEALVIWQRAHPKLPLLCLEL